MPTLILHPGDCILIQGKSFVSRGIMWFTKSKYSHVAMYVGGGKGYIVEATAAGVEINKLEDLIKHSSAYAVRRIPGLTVDQAEAMKDKAYALIYDDYDFVQLASLGLYYLLRKCGISWSLLVRSARNKMICSELFAVCCLVIPIKFKSKTKLVTPDTLYTTSLMETILEFEHK